MHRLTELLQTWDCRIVIIHSCSVELDPIAGAELCISVYIHTYTYMLSFYICVILHV